MTDREEFENVIAEPIGLDTTVLCNSKNWGMEYADTETSFAYLVYKKTTLAQQSKIESLEIQVQELREALIVCKQYITEAIIDDKYHEASCSLDELYLLRDKAINLHKQALANTPNVSEWVRRDRLEVSCYELRIKCKGMIEKFHRATNVDGGEPLYRIKGE